jgi:hypothetical protein
LWRPATPKERASLQGSESEPLSSGLPRSSRARRALLVQGARVALLGRLRAATAGAGSERPS